jgi:hypothetical protein
MIVEQRTYTLLPGRVTEYFRLYQAEGAAVQRKHLGRLLGYYSSEIGELNQVIHLWAYEDLMDRSQRRAALFADEEWLTYFNKIIAFVTRQSTQILVPAPFIMPKEGEWREMSGC